MPSPPQFPTLVMIIRHGEKPGDPGSDTDGGPDLSTMGSGRAAALPSLFTPDPNAQMPVANWQQFTCKLSTGAESQFTGVYGDSNIFAGQPRFLIPNFLFATQPSSDSSRPVETITPLAQALQFFYDDPTFGINSYYNNDPNDQNQGLPALKNHILNNPEIYGGQVVLICWHHGTIPQLTELFGVPASDLPWTSWPADVFDLVFLIYWVDGQPNFAIDCQQLLYGDSSTAPNQNQ